MAVRIPMKMVNGKTVQTMAELREHFDLASVLGYYDNGQLYRWLELRYCEDEANKIRALDKNAPDFNRNLCEILGVEYSEESAAKVSLSDAAVKNERLDKLRKHTADDKILAAVDSVAFRQEELDMLLADGAKTVYLCEGSFTIPEDRMSVKYIEVGNPNVEYGAEGILQLAKNAQSDVEAFRLWSIAAEQGNAVAQCELAACYSNGKGVEQNKNEMVKWERKAAEQGYAKAQYYLGNSYAVGAGDLAQNYEEAIKWYRKAAEQGYAEAQNWLGLCYWDGKGVEKNLVTANQWFLKAAELGYDWAQFNLAKSYHYGNGVTQNNEEAVKWCEKAAEQGNADAQYS